MHTGKTQPRFIYAALLFLSLNVAILSFCGERTLAMLLPGSLSEWTKQYQSQTRSPDVVLLGSSVIRSPLAECDKANFGITDNLGYCQSKQLEKLLSSSTEKITVFNAARRGLMVTDALLMEDRLMRKPLLPKVLIYGVSPRDFTDSLMWNERTTEPFQYYFGLSNAIRYGESFASSWQERLELLAGETMPLYSARKTIASVIEKKIACRLPTPETLQPSIALSDQDINAKRIERLRSDAVFDYEAAFMSTTVQRNAAALLEKRHDETAIWQASIWQYTMRYFLLDRRRFGRQSKAFRNLLKIAKERGIKILVINLPLPSDNLTLLPTGFYQAYLETIRDCCAKQTVTFLDLQADRTFTRASFDDVTHLNASGGAIFMDRMVPIVSQLLHGSQKAKVNLPPKSKEYSDNENKQKRLNSCSKR